MAYSVNPFQQAAESGQISAFGGGTGLQGNPFQPAPKAGWGYNSSLVLDDAGFNYVPPPGLVGEGSDGTSSGMSQQGADPYGGYANIGGADNVSKDVARYSGEVDQAIASVERNYHISVPKAVVQAMMQVESGGNPNARSDAGYLGLMQIGPGSSYLGSRPDLSRAYDPAYNVLKGVEELAAKYMATKSVGLAQTWDNAIRLYHGLGSDGNTSDWDYLALVKRYAGTGQGSGGVKDPSGSGGYGLNTITGGQSYPISQEYGMTSFARGNSSYNYTSQYSPTGQVIGHGGLDVGTPYGTALYTPVAGTVITAGGTQYFCNRDAHGGSCGSGDGELRIKLDNGDELILGHMSGMNVRVGQRVNAGSMVGKSGSENGAHVHVEYRKYAPGRTSSGYLLVDPRNVLGGGGAYTPGGSSGSSQTLQQPRSSTIQLLWNMFGS